MEIGDEFEVKDTFAAINNQRKYEIGNYLKILFVDYYEYIIENPQGTQKIIWAFSDNYMSADNRIIQDIMNIAQSGRTIADHGEEKILNNTTKVIFDFEVLDSQKRGAQNFFGYKLTYQDLFKEETNENENILGNNTQENQTNETENKKPILQNNKTNENNTENITNETTPETQTQNKTEENITNPENNYDNISDNENTTIMDNIPVNETQITTNINTENAHQDRKIQQSIMIIKKKIFQFKKRPEPQ